MFLVFELGRPKGDLRSRGRDEDLAFFFSEESRSSSEFYYGTKKFVCKGVCVSKRYKIAELAHIWPLIG